MSGDSTVPAVVRRRRPDPTLLPDRPVAYHQLLRGPRWRWWRPLLSLLLVAVFLVVLGFGLSAAFLGLDAVLPDRVVGTLGDEGSPLTMLQLDLILAGLIPTAMLATALAHRVRPRWVSSVVGGVRWPWLARCVLVLVPLWAVYLTVTSLLQPLPPGRPGHWVLLLVLAVAVTPFQAAGEEYLFRGWLVQNLGGYFARPLAGFVVTTLTSAALFAVAHGSFHPWALLDLAVFGAAACIVNRSTGGLEAGVAIHAVNNVGIAVLTISYGGYSQSFVTGDTTGSPGELAGTVALEVAAVLLVQWQGRRAGVRRTTAPADGGWTSGPFDPVGPPDAT